MGIIVGAAQRQRISLGPREGGAAGSAPVEIEVTEADRCGIFRRGWCRSPRRG